VRGQAPRQFAWVVGLGMMPRGEVGLIFLGNERTTASGWKTMHHHKSVDRRSVLS